ncbi:MAG: tetratricopeptide repeat protein [Marinifilaceae bacterium]|jgi:tetratricopeptide (TPR) repeat protein|nr:tetratricopeptide repeat protein [Marinifilaceae bacterium]
MKNFFAIFLCFLIQNDVFSQKSDSLENVILINDLNSQIEDDPNNYFYYGARGTIYYSIGELKKAIADFNRAIELNTQEWETYYNKGIAESELGNYSVAIKSLKKALEMNANSPWVYFGLGNTFLIMDEYEKAIDNYTMSINNGGDWAHLYYNKSYALIKLNRYSEAEGDLLQLKRIEPDSPEYLAQMGYLFISKGDFDMAIEFLREAYEKDPKNVYTNYYMWEYYKNIGKKNVGIHYYKLVKEKGIPREL